MTVDPSVIPGLLFLLAEFAALAAVGYVIVRTALRESDDRVALAQGLVVGPAIWGVVVNLVMYLLPGLAGALAGWIFVLALAAVLTWRAPKPVRPRPHTTAVFAIVTLALFWVALASRQSLGIVDMQMRIGLTASIREGAFPPELPWNPSLPVLYHYGPDMLNALLAPPFGPDLAFVTELTGAYAWIGLALVVATALLRRSSGFAVLVIVPLLLTLGARTLVPGEPAGIVEATVPVGIPAAGLRASLMDIYQQSELPWDSRYSALANIRKPVSTVSYALAFIVLIHAASARRRSWPATLTLAVLIGFLGLASTSLVPIALVLWAGLEAVHLIQSRRAGSLPRRDVIRSASGLALAALLPLAGGFSSIVLGASATSGFSLGTSEFFGGWRLLGTLDRLPGGVGILGLGPLAVAAAAGLLARRNRLVLALAAGTALLLLVTLLFTYEPSPWDLVRLEGHARNFALFALLIALSVRLARLHTRWRYAAGAALIALVTLPTVLTPVRNTGLAIGNGIEFANAQAPREPPGTHSTPRQALENMPSDHIAAYIRNNTKVDARVFSPHPHPMTYATGRSNASGFAGLVHLIPRQGPEYRDVLDYLEPAAVRRLGFEYVYAPDSWLESLPAEAAERLDDPNLFELLVRDGSESLYRVLPAFLSLDVQPAPASYEALRQAVPTSTTVFTPAIFKPKRLIRATWSLSHARLLGDIDHATRTLHLRTSWTAEPLGDHTPDLVITSAQFDPWMFPSTSRQPIWRNEDAAVYALDGTVDRITPSPRPEPFLFSVRVSDLRAADGRAVFTATFDDRAPDQWSGQDWIIIATQSPPRDFPTKVLPDDRTSAMHIWFSGQISPGLGTTSVAYELNLLASSMAFRHGDGAFTLAGASEAQSSPGVYMLAVRLRHEYKPNQWRAGRVAHIPYAEDHSLRGKYGLCRCAATGR